MLLSDRILFGSLFAFIELPEKISVVTLNLYSKTLSEITGRCCVVEYPLDHVFALVSVITWLPEQIPTATLKVSFRAL